MRRQRLRLTTAWTWTRCSDCEVAAMTIEEAMRHAGAAARDWQYAERRGRDALPKYIWTEGGKRHRTGYCAECHCDVDLTEAAISPGWVANDPYIDYEDAHHWEMELNLRGPWFSLAWNGADAMDGSGAHGHFGRCPHCGAVAQYRSMHRGRKNVRDRAFLIRYVQSEIEPDALVMLGWLVWRDWGAWDDYNEWEPPIDEDLREIVVFRPGEGGSRFIRKTETWADWDSAACRAVNIRSQTGPWIGRKKAVSGFDPCPGPYYGGGTRFYLDTEQWLDAIGSMPWGGVAAHLVEESQGEIVLDHINECHFASKYRCMEYLHKLGLTNIAIAEYDGKRGELLNLRGKTAARVLRVDGDTWGWIKGHRNQATPDFLRIHRLLKARGARIGNDLVARIAARWNSHNTAEALNAIQPGQEARAIRYMLRKEITPNDYRDYLRQMEQLRMRKTEDLLYPADFEEMHRRLTGRIKNEGSRINDRKIMERLEKLGVYWFSALGLTLRPMLSSREIIREGSEMHHCVGGYVQRYADGGTVLLALRKDTDLNTPWHTVEFTVSGQMVQCRGFRNQTKPEDQPLIDEFWKLFAAHQAAYAIEHSAAGRMAQKIA